jgi:hypothetical protein
MSAWMSTWCSGKKIIIRLSRLDLNVGVNKELLKKSINMEQHIIDTIHVQCILTITKKCSTTAENHQDS